MARVFQCFLAANAARGTLREGFPMATTEKAAATGVKVYEIDPAHTEVEFAVKHLMFTTVKGRFADVAGTIRLDDEHAENSSVEVTINVTSVDTRQEQRDGHLRSADFFDVEKYPTMTFKSTKVEKKGNDLRVTGDLTLHGVTREVVLQGEENGRGPDPWGNEKIAFTATTKVDRTDFGLNYNQALETGGVLVGTDIKITLEIQAKRTS
jgi:polyisoprenoid-binding protein YceI